jgi:small subunit ribosomal protein S6
MREYETLYILRSDLSDDAIGQVNDRLTGVLDREGAKILKCHNMGKKKLAFEVAKNPKGIFMQMSFLSEPTVIKEFERNMRMIEQVVRYQTIKMFDVVDVDKRLAKQAAEDRERAAAEAERKAKQEAAEAEARKRAEAELAVRQAAEQKRQEAEEEKAQDVEKEKED